MVRLVYTGHVQFYVNPEVEVVKTFDSYNILSTYQQTPDTFIAYQNDGTLVRGALTTTTLQYREGSWRDKMPRVLDKSSNGGTTWATAPTGEVGRRLRGTHGQFTLEFDTTNTSGTTSVLTKYRPIPLSV